MGYIDELGIKAKEAKRSIASAGTTKKDEILKKIAEVLRANVNIILEENARDIAAAKDNGISEAMTDRVRLTKERIDGIADACIHVLTV